MTCGLEAEVSDVELYCFSKLSGGCWIPKHVVVGGLAVLVCVSSVRGRGSRVMGEFLRMFVSPF